MHSDIPAYLVDQFLSAGWVPQRRVKVPEGIPPDHPAYCVLEEFGGLNVYDRSEPPGWRNFNFFFTGPQKDAGEGETWSALLRSRLVMIGHVHHHGWLYLDDSGRCFGASQMHEAFYFNGASLFEAMDARRPFPQSQPLLHPDQVEVDLYGKTFRRGDPGLFRY